MDYDKILEDIAQFRHYMNEVEKVVEKLGLERGAVEINFREIGDSLEYLYGYLDAMEKFGVVI
ncbi:MAG: hypothetical protein FWE38_01980 [Firmicutes bacterium]|nr:hypothetical protein [Bacillota bacterium]